MATPYGRPLVSEQSQFKFPEVVCVLDLETSGKDAIKPDRADLAVVGLKVYTWDEQQQGYLPGPYEHYSPADFSTLQQRLDALPGPIIGHNLFGFDYRVLRRHINVGHIVEKTVDTLHFLYEKDEGGEDGSLYSLDKLAKENFGESKTMKASTIPQLLKEGRLDEVLVYNERDCDLTFRVWWKMVSERRISVGNVWSDSGFDGDYELAELTYDLEEKDIDVLTCTTPRFTFTAWVEQYERDGWIVMPPAERKRREKERERLRTEAREIANKRNGAMREFIAQHLRNDIPPKFAQSKRDSTAVSLDLGEEARALLSRADLPRSAWAEEVIYRLFRGEHIYPTKLEVTGRPDDPEERAKLMKDIIAALINEGYSPRYYASHEPDSDSLSLAGPPPTFAQQYVAQIRQRHFEMDALFGPAGIKFEVQRWASNVHPAYMDAMNVLYGGGYIVFEDGSYVLDSDEIDIFQLQPKMLTSEERADLEAYLQDPPSEFTVAWHCGVEGHDMALHRHTDASSQEASFHMSCTCGWQSELSVLEIDALASGVLHVRGVGRHAGRRPVLRFREHILTSSKLSVPGSHNSNEERWIGLCACGWSYVERTEADGDEAFEKHWTALLDDPEMHADYLAFLDEDGRG